MTSGYADGRLKRAQKLAKDQADICPWCLERLPDDLNETEIDHIIPRSLNGPNLEWNRQVLHKKCNRAKRAALTAEAEATAHRRGIPLMAPGADDRPLWVKELDCDYRLTADEREQSRAIQAAMDKVMEEEGPAQQRAARHAGAHAVSLSHWWFLFTAQSYRELQLR